MRVDIYIHVHACTRNALSQVLSRYKIRILMNSNNEVLLHEYYYFGPTINT